jgi:hypothetical protein
MKKTIVLFCLLISAMNLLAQECKLNEEATRYMVRGKSAIELAEKPEDYKLAATEFLKVAEYAPKCPDVYYNLSLCYEQMGKLDPGNYQEAISYLQTYLQLSPNAANKQEIQERIYKLEFVAEKAGGVSLKRLIGKWKFFWGDGGNDDSWDIEIFENNGNFYARFLCDYRLRKWHDMESNRMVVRNCYGMGLKESPLKGCCITANDFCTAIIKYADGTISFETNLYVESYLAWTYKPHLDEGSSSYWKLNYNLKINNGKLQGNRICNRYKVCKVYAGEDDKNWICNTDCTGDCGENNVYFVKQ